MKSDFQIQFRHSVGNLHVHLNGAFNGMCAWELLKILKQHGNVGRVFVDTSDVKQVRGDGVSLFRSHMTNRQRLQDWLYFKGRKGFKIAPDGSRVLICNKSHKLHPVRKRHLEPTLSMVKTINRTLTITV